YVELPGWCRGFAVATLPFVVNELTRHANPLKLREYLAAGLPVVSTDIPESRALGRICPDGLAVADGDEVVSAVVARARSGDAGPRAERSRAVAGESWDSRVGELAVALEEALARSKGPRSYHAEAH